MHTHISNEQILLKKPSRCLYTGKKSVKRKRFNKQKKTEILLKNNIVTNLSHHKLTIPELSILNKGLTFVPSINKVEYSKIHSDFISFERRLQLQYFFKDKQQRQDESKGFETNPEWWPLKLNPKTSNTFCGTWNLPHSRCKVRRHHRAPGQQFPVRRRNFAESSVNFGG